MVDFRSGCARVLVTLKCNRACRYCVNGNADVMSKAQTVGYEELIEARLPLFRELVITGGEPMLNAQAVAAFADDARQANPGLGVFLYTSEFDIEDMSFVIPKLDGLTFTLHAPVSGDDMRRLAFLQTMSAMVGKHFRLCLGPGIDSRLEIVPARWSRIKTFDLSAEACRLPANETLYVMEGGLW